MKTSTHRLTGVEGVIKLRTCPTLLWLAVFCCLLLTLTPSLFADTSSRENALLSFGQLNASPIRSGFKATGVALSERVSPAVVQIVATGYGLVPGNGSNRANVLAQQRSGGTGVIVDPDGYIVTNAHLVSGAQRVRVLLAPRVTVPFGSSILKPRGNLIDGHIVGIDSETDLAVIKIEPTGLPFLPLGDSDELRPGQLVFAYGSPLGLENSVTMGVVSAVARQLQNDAPMIYIQTDAAINPGNSGARSWIQMAKSWGLTRLFCHNQAATKGLALPRLLTLCDTSMNRFAKTDGFVVVKFGCQPRRLPQHWQKGWDYR
jgi:S1-C subfamily serine protease